ncbi:MAG: hypothetical protein FGM32_02695 [Candidatus Kapabacteria bacterium]|nr:hypothetical protein [Candidatus Kapabacteria bacterium]
MLTRTMINRAVLTYCLLQLVVLRGVAQEVQRLPITTGFNQDVTIVPTSVGVTWLIDLTTVYWRSTTWQALPELYRCGPAAVVEAGDRLTVVAKRQTPSDTSWWMFRTSRAVDAVPVWQDSVALNVAGRFLGGAWGWMLFSSSDMADPMAIEVIGPTGEPANVMYMTRVRNSPAAMVRQCGDSVIIIDRGISSTMCEVIRGGALTSPLEWTTVLRPEILDGKVGDGNAFVYQTSEGTYLDHQGRVRPVQAFTDRLPSLTINGTMAARVARGGVEFAPDITTTAVTLCPATPRLYTNSDVVKCIASPSAIFVQRIDGRVDELRSSRDSAFQERWRTVEAISGSQSRGPFCMVSGPNVIVADHYVTRDETSAPCISTIVPGPATCDTSVVRIAPALHQVLRRVANDVWLTTESGIVSYPSQRMIQQRPGYEVVSIGGRIYMQTARGIEVRRPDDSLFRVLVPDEIGLGMTVVGDTILVIKLQSVSSPEPEGQFTADAFDLDGNPYYFDRLVAGDTRARLLSYRSISTIGGSVILNLGRRLFVSTDAGTTWADIDAGVEFLTSIDPSGAEVVAWARQPDGRTGPALMVRPDTWVVQPVEMRSAAPILACATMPGWFVFSTANGAWCVKKLVSSVANGNPEGDSEFFDRVDDEVLFDVRGRSFLRASAPSGSYFHAVRIGAQWRIRSIVTIP